MVALSIKVDPAFSLAIKEHAKEMGIGQGTVLQSLALRADPTLRKRHAKHQRSLRLSQSEQEPHVGSLVDLA